MNPKWKYYIPILGWLIAVVEYQKAGRAYWRAKKAGLPAWAEYHATWPAFENTHTAFIATFLPLGVAGLLVAIVGALRG